MGSEVWFFLLGFSLSQSLLQAALEDGYSYFVAIGILSPTVEYSSSTDRA